MQMRLTPRPSGPVDWGAMARTVNPNARLAGFGNPFDQSETRGFSTTECSTRSATGGADGSINPK